MLQTSLLMLQTSYLGSSNDSANNEVGPGKTVPNKAGPMPKCTPAAPAAEATSA